MKADYSSRKYTIIALAIIMGVIFLSRLFYVQIILDQYKRSANHNVIRAQKIYPSRGYIYDRHQQLIVGNDASYDLMVTPRKVKDLDTIAFCQLLQIDSLDFTKRMAKAKKYSYRKPSLFLNQISKEQYAYIQEALYAYKGFYVQERTLRRYPYPAAALTLGDIGEVNQSNLQKDAYYRSGDYIGKSGLEKFYETTLRGKKGVSFILVDVFNRAQGKYKGGAEDIAAIHGKHLYTSLDIELQSYGEQLMQNKIGSIVAIEPTSGEILALVSSPSFDPSMLVGRQRGQHFSALSKDRYKPLFNRALMANYPPGSTFKMINALIAMQEGVLQSGSYFSCAGPESRPIRCTHYHQTPLALSTAIQQSCNPYFWQVYNRILNNKKYKNTKAAYKAWHDKVQAFGLGQKFKTDLMFERQGKVPTAAYYDKAYHKRWNALTVRSLSIGQGELLLSPLQLANVAACMANRGYYFSPHLVRAIGQADSITTIYKQKHNVGIERKHFASVIKGMHRVIAPGGTATLAAVEGLEVCGKTGTVQNPHGKDHSLFIAFAPMDKPTIAIAVVVENTGDYGGTWAAPIAGLMMEKYFFKNIKSGEKEEMILKANLLPKKTK